MRTAEVFSTEHGRVAYGAARPQMMRWASNLKISVLPFVTSAVTIGDTHGCLGRVSVIDVSGNIFSKTTKKRHNAKINVCCNSSNLIYCLTCNTCEKYVGMTKRKLRQRLYEHLRNICQGSVNDPIGRHFSKVPHNQDPSKVRVHVLSFITHPPDSRTALNMRLRFELDWIHRLQTTLPRGLNAMD